jgi:hypothetical protein
VVALSRQPRVKMGGQGHHASGLPGGSPSTASTSMLDEGTVGFYTLLDDPEYWEVSIWLYYSNLFQHQTHHRGQAHNMLSQCGLSPPSIGYIEFHVELGTFVKRTPPQGSKL